MAPRLEVNDDLAIGERTMNGRFDLVRDAFSLHHGLPGRDGYDRVGKIVTTGLSDAQAAQLDAIADVADSSVSAGMSLGWRGLHQDSRVLENQTGCRREDDPGNE